MKRSTLCWAGDLAARRTRFRIWDVGLGVQGWDFGAWGLEKGD